MKQIDELDGIEATFTLNRASQRVTQDVIQDAEKASRILRSAVSSVAGEEVASHFVEYVKRDEAGAVARVALGEITRERAEFDKLAGEVDQMLLDPPRADQLDLGISIGMLTLCGLAMVLMSRVEVSSKKEQQADGSTSDEFKFVFQGNEAVAKLVTNLVAKLGI